LFSKSPFDVEAGTDSSCKLYVLRLDGHSLPMDGAEVGHLEHVHQVSFGCFLKCRDCTLLKSQFIVSDFARYLSQQSSHRREGDEEICRFLIKSNLSQPFELIRPLFLLKGNTALFGLSLPLSRCFGGHLLPRLVELRQVTFFSSWLLLQFLFSLFRSC
jgi:hypothetical protein